jgi:hypothetical protein
VILVILSSADDYHTRCVQHELEKRGDSVFVADASELCHGAVLTFSPHDPDATEWRRKDGRSLRLGMADVVWFRRNLLAVPPPTVSDAEDRRFITREWHQLVSGAFDSIPARLVDPPAAGLAATKPRQLALARRAGLSIPSTVITSCTAAAREFVGRHAGRVVHKTMTPSATSMFETRRWGAQEDAAIDDLSLAPTILQQYVEAEREVRITIVGDQIFAAEYRPVAVDGRLDGDARYTAHVLPGGVERGLHRLMKSLSLTFATGDIRITPSGEYVFLELNPQGQFLWIEIQTGQQITRTMAEFLRQPSAMRVGASMGGR